METPLSIEPLSSYVTSDKKVLVIKSMNINKACRTPLDLHVRLVHNDGINFLSQMWRQLLSREFSLLLPQLHRVFWVTRLGYKLTIQSIYGLFHKSG